MYLQWIKPDNYAYDWIWLPVYVSHSPGHFWSVDIGWPKFGMLRIGYWAKGEYK